MSRKQLKALAKRIHSMQQFAEACINLSNNDIYELYECEITADLKQEIDYTFWSVSPEPCRAALRQLGARYCIHELEVY